MRTTLAALLLPILAHAAEQEVFTIKVLPAQMRYDVTELTISPGAQVKITFENPDDMPHNIVFCQPGTDVVAVSNKQMERPDEAMKRNWLPEDPAIWLHSRLLNPKESEEIVFKAPEKPGVYPFVCTFPGHAVTMQGRIKIFAPGPQLKELKYQVYLGDWKKLPDFAKLQPSRGGTMPDNLVQPRFDELKDQYALVFTGKLNATKEAEYTFALASDDGARLLIDGKKVVENDGIHPAAEIREGKAKLKPGEHEFRLEYFQADKNAELYVAWRGEEFGHTPLSHWVHPKWQNAASAKKKDDKMTGIPLAPGKEPIIYRQFVTGAGNRPISVGYPGGLSIAWSAECMNLVYAWRGAFIDAARHWRDRGGGPQPPLGYDVLRFTPEIATPFAVLAAPDAAWPKPEKNMRPAGYAWKGYKLDAQRVPTFFYKWEGVEVADRISPVGDNLVRTLKLTGAIPAEALFRLAESAAIRPAGSAFTVEGGKLTLGDHDFPNSFTVAADGARIAGQNLVVPARAEIKITYSWPAGHAHTPAPASR